MGKPTTSHTIVLIKRRLTGNPVTFRLRIIKLLKRNKP
jgi:hypothetical protein